MITLFVPCKGISCLEIPVADCTWATYFQMNFDVSLNLGLICHSFATIEAGVNTGKFVFTFLYHRLQSQIEF